MIEGSLTLGAARPCPAGVLGTSAFASVLQERGGPSGRLHEACRSCIEASSILISIDLWLLFLLSSFRFPTWCLRFHSSSKSPNWDSILPFLLPAGHLLGGWFHSSLPTSALPLLQPTNLLPPSSFRPPTSSFPDNSFLCRTLFPSFFTFSSFKSR